MSEGGYFYDENGRIESDDATALDAELAAEEKRRKSFVTPERIERILTTEDLRKSFGAMSAATFTVSNLSVLEKQQTVLEIREMGIPDEEVLKNSATVYIGAGLDLEYPLSLGARKIMMVDPIYKDPSYVDSLRLKVSTLSKGLFTENNNLFSFKFDFGQGKEDVVVMVDPRMFTGDQNDSNTGGDQYVPPDTVGGVIVFQGEDPSVNNELIQRMVPGGIILSNRWLDRMVDDYFDAHPKQHETFNEGSESEKRKILEEIYAAQGFAYIQLESDKNSLSRTFLKKRAVVS